MNVYVLRSFHTKSQHIIHFKRYRDFISTDKQRCLNLSTVIELLRVKLQTQSDYHYSSSPHTKIELTLRTALELITTDFRLSLVIRTGATLDTEKLG